ncbi:MAG: cytidylate kinase-like family protein [Oscillospiraceae bacterium]|nr:cytidylate kinase-like family protein [Oscillospiraceae bacterium]MBQ2329480.1 cytidylate kinase-like family protein [Oscillospiraceae bacterium]
MKRTIIAISREHGAGGTAIGKKLSEELGIPVYERKVIELAAEKSGLSADYIGSLEENSSRSFLFNLVSHSYSPAPMLPQYDVPVTFSAYAAQGQVIKELAAAGSCIVIGRCAEYILRDDPDVITVFLRADREDRIAYVMEESGLDRKGAEQKLKQIDRGRANYYRGYTGDEWGSVENHDISINTSVSGIDGAVKLIVDLIEATGRM